MQSNAISLLDLWPKGLKRRLQLDVSVLLGDRLCRFVIAL